MNPISYSLTPRKKVLEGNLQGFIQIYDVEDENRLEGSPNDFLEVTQPTDALDLIFKHTRHGIREGGNTSFFLVGPFGTGKTHSIIALYHILNNPDIGNSWLNDKNIDLTIPSEFEATWVSGTDDQPDYLWEPLFERLGRSDLLESSPEGSSKPPSKKVLRKLVKEQPVAFFIDEIEDWYGGLDEKERNKNNDFLQVITEVAADERYDLFLFLTFLDKDSELKKLLEDRTNPISLNLDVQVDWKKVINHRLFENQAAEKLKKEIAEKYSQKSSTVSYEKIKECYPFHPQVFYLLENIWGPEGEEQGVRNPLRELGNAIAENYDDVDLILVSDLDYNLDDPKSLLPGINRSLATKWSGDLERCGEIEGSEPVLKVLYGYSLLPQPGASEEQVVQCVVRSDMSRDEALLPLQEILNSPSAYHVDERDGKYVITEERRIPKIISDRGDRFDFENDVKPKINQILTEKIFQNAYFINDIPDDISSEVKNDTDFKLIIAPEGLNDGEINETFQEFKYQNTLTVITPNAADSAYEDEVEEKARRIMGADKLMEETDIDEEELKQEKRKDMTDLKNRLKNRYGRAYRYTEDNDLIPMKISPDLDQIKGKLKASQPEIREKIRNSTGNRAKQILEDCRKLKSAPIILDENEFHEALQKLFEDEEIGLDGNKLYHAQENDFPSIQTAMNSIVRSSDEILQKIRGKEPEFEFARVDIPSKLNIGEKTELEVEMENIDARKADKKLVLTIDGDEIDSSQIELEGEESTTKKFSIEVDEEGKHNIGLEINGKTESQSVIVEPEEGFKEAIFTAEDIRFPQEGTMGENLNVSFTLKNEGHKKGISNISLYLSKEEVESREVELSEEESQEVKLSTIPEVEGKEKLTLKVDGKTEKEKEIEIKTKKTIIDDQVQMEGRAPFEARKLEEDDEVYKVEIALQRDQILNKKELEELLNSVPDGTPIKITINYRRERE